MKRFFAALGALLVLSVAASAQPQITGLSNWSIFLDPGHSQKENMGVYGYSEAEKVLRVGLHAKFLLETMTDIDTVYIARTNDNMVVSLTQRTDFSNRVSAAFYHSIHSNAGGSTTNNVLMLWGQNGAFQEKVPNGGKAMSDIMIRHLRDGMRLPSIGSRGDCSFYGCSASKTTPYLHVNRESVMASTLSEAGFHTNPTQNMKNMNADWKKLEAWIHFITYLEFMGVERPPMSILNGIVKNPENGLPVNGATVTVEGEDYVTDSFDSLFKNYTSNPNLLQNGFYYFEGVSPGDVEISVSAPGYYPKTINATMVDTFFTFADVELISSTPPTVVSTTPAEATERFRRLDPVIFNFSRPMNRNSVAAALSFEPAVNGTYSWSNNDTRLTFRPDELLPLTDYVVTISPEALDNYDHEMDGDADGVGGDSFVLTFSTGPDDVLPPAVTAVYPPNNEFVDELRPVISVTFDEMVIPEDLVKENFTLSLFSNSSYTVDGQFASYNVNGQSVVNFFPERKLAADRIWRFLTAAGLRDAFDNATTTTRTLRFRTSFDDVSVRLADSFDSGIANWWIPSQSGSTTGTVPDSVVVANDSITKLLFAETGSSYRFRYGWDTEASSPLVRIYTPPGSAVRNVSFNSQSLVQMYVFGDGSGTKVRFAVEDQDAGSARLEVSPWKTIDWIGWKLVSWDIANEGVGSWIGNGVLNGTLRIESIQLTRGDTGTPFGTIWFDDLRIAEKIIATDLADDQPSELPNSIELDQNYPNPFNPSTTISFSLAESGQVELSVFSVTGQKVADILNANMNAGRHQVNFDASRLASGTYIYRLRSAGVELSRKMVLVK
jgi:N-acetylmuramoyl-L-alanine amidase